jgi:RsiW-degrading membrane proteinase PrsW (M82 family)
MLKSEWASEFEYIAYANTVKYRIVGVMFVVFFPIILAEIGVGWLFIRYLILRDRGPKEPPKILLFAGILGVVGFAVAFVVEKWLLPAVFVNDPQSLSTGSLAGNSLLVGVIEEGFKSLPLALFLFRKGYFNEVTDGIIYFGISGMVFGIIEDIGYAWVLGPAAGIAKIISGPYIHAGFCVLFGWTLARRKVVRAPWLFVGAGLLTAIVLHGLYDFGLMYGHSWSILLSLCITVAVNCGIFLLYHFSERTDARLGLSAVGNNYYCRACGRPNPRRFLFCLHCGQRT